jgi:hypothetical protein
MQDAVLGVDPLEVVRDLAAQEADRDRVVRISGHSDRPPLLDRDVHRAGVRAVVRAGAAYESSGHQPMVRPAE